MIRARGVTLRARRGVRGRPALLDSVDLDIRAGEHVILAGANGAGKSLLLQALARLRPPTTGTITYDDPDMSVGLVFQSPDDQIVGSTVERDLAFGLENQGVQPVEIRRRVADAITWAGLETLAHRPPHLLSEGEKQRVALTSALILRPSLLLLDEPTARLDPDGRALFLSAMMRAREESGASVVQVTHRSEEMVAADRVVGMERGRVVFDGTMDELVDGEMRERLGILWSPRHRFRMELAGRGIQVGEEGCAGWNDLNDLLEAIGA